MIYLNLMNVQELKNLINPKKEPTKDYFLDLLDADKQLCEENAHIQAVMSLLRVLYILKHKNKLTAARTEKEALLSGGDYNAEKYRRVLELNSEISALKAKIKEYKPFFDEPYFARMDLTDDKEGYNSYYIGKHGDEKLEILDWR
ncbi:MAG: hypothetical protein K2I29_06605, partial [Clostridia bacterium]|nr:hypothetical protein [Clostridia bacterium]